VLNSVFVVPVSPLQWLESGEDRLAHEIDLLTSKDFLLTMTPESMILEACLSVIWAGWLS